MVFTWRQLGLEHLQGQNPVSVANLGVILSLVSKAHCLPGGSLALSISKATMLMMRIQMGESRSSGSFYANKNKFLSNLEGDRIKKEKQRRKCSAPQK
jgi:hypothetical protein